MNHESDIVDQELEIFREPSSESHIDHNRFTKSKKKERSCSLIVVVGAKGGIGKSLFSINLGVYLATIGRKVVVVDADPHGANLHTFLGVSRPNPLVSYIPPLPSFRRAAGVNLDAFGPAYHAVREAPQFPKIEEKILENSLKSISLTDTSVPGLRLMHAGFDEPLQGRMHREKRHQFEQRCRALDADYVVVDAGAGIDRTLLDLYLKADVTLFLTLPEPTSIENTYTFIRASFAKYVRNQVTDLDDRQRLTQWQRKLAHIPAPIDLYRRLEAEGDPLMNVVRDAMESFHFCLALNQTRLRADLELGDRMRSATLRRLGIWIDYLGYIDFDDTVWTCVRAQRPLLVESPGTKASKSIEKIARRLLAIDAGKMRSRKERTVPPDTHHDLLEVQRGATDEEIRRAYKRVREIYAHDALCCYGLFDEAGLHALRARLDEAYDVLLDPARRRPYELSVFPDDALSQRQETVPPPNLELIPAPIITPETEFRGALLRAVRESKGFDIRDICRRTKIGFDYVQAIEKDDYSNLPALVYVRGFVTEIAKSLKLDPEQVSRTYIRGYRRWLDDQGRT